MTALKELKQGALQSAAYDTLLQICLRVVSFILNAVVVRSVGAATLAVCSVRLLLLYSTTLLLTREAFRRAALAAKPHQLNAQLVNLLWISCAALVPVSALLGLLWCIVMAPPPLDVVPVPAHYTASVALMLLSCLIELCAETPFVLAELQLWSKTRVIIEGLMQLLRSVLVAGAVLVFPGLAVLNYSLAHVAGSCLYCGCYYWVWQRAFREKESQVRLPFTGLRQLLPSRQPGEWLPRTENSVGRVARGFFLQCWLKELLTEGEWFLMNFLPLITLTQQGTYQVVSNLGALGARLVFRSIETAAYKFFAQTVQRDTPLTKQPSDRVREAAEFLWSLLRGLTLLSLTILCFGWSYSHSLLQLYGGSQLSNAGTGLMRAQCVLLVFLALNGVTEAYTFAAMSHQQLNRHSALLMVFSVVYLVLAATLSHTLGAVGFVLANCVNMMLRILHGWVFIHRQFTATQHRPLSALAVPVPLLLSFVAAGATVAVSEMMVYPRSLLLHLSGGVAVMLTLLYCLRWQCRGVYSAALRLLDSTVSRRFEGREEKDKSRAYRRKESSAARRHNTDIARDDAATHSRTGVEIDSFALRDFPNVLTRKESLEERGDVTEDANENLYNTHHNRDFKFNNVLVSKLHWFLYKDEFRDERTI